MTMTGPGGRPGPSLNARALKLLALRDHSRAELARKLLVHEPDEATVVALLDQFEAKGWLSDSRFAQGLVRSRAARYGNRRLRADLLGKGVSGEEAAEALKTLGGDEADRARAWWERRFGAPPANAQERARQFRHMLSRGYAADVVQRVVPPVSDVGPDDDDASADSRSRINRAASSKSKASRA